MLYHASIPANDPQHAASVIAELWGGEALPFPPCPGGWMAMAGDDRNTAIECYPARTTIHPGLGEEDECVFVENQPVIPTSAFHLAIATDLSDAEVKAIAAREGWRAVTCERGAGLFAVIEFWLENRLMIEVLTHPMQARYLENVSIDGFKAMLAAGPDIEHATLTAPVAPALAA